MTQQASGVHLIGDFVNCKAKHHMTDAKVLEQYCVRAVSESGLTAVRSDFHSFGEGEGVTGMILLAESHLSLHTWPEIDYVSLDVFVCNYTQNNSEKAQALFDALTAFFQPETPNQQVVTRGPQLRLQRWMGEEMAPGLKVSLRADSEVKSAAGLQRSALFSNDRFGKVFMLDEVFMTSEKDEFFYHENLVHPAAIAHAAPRRALVIGGGDGIAARELLKHPDMESVVNVDIDGSVFDVGRDALADINGGVFNDERFKPVVMDGARFVEEGQGQYDLIVLDLTDPNVYSLPVYTADFYRACRKRLAPGGLLSLHAESPFLKPRTWRRIIATLQDSFPIVAPSAVPIPLYGGFWGMATASADADVRELSEHEVDRRIAQRGLALRYYNGGTHRAMHALPNFMQEMLGKQAEPITPVHPPEGD
jgi:spermidine synthase